MQPRRGEYREVCPIVEGGGRVSVYRIRGSGGSSGEMGGLYPFIEKSRNLLIGPIGSELKRESQNAEMTGWIGKPYRRNGFHTEATEKFWNLDSTI